MLLMIAFFSLDHKQWLEKKVYKGEVSKEMEGWLKPIQKGKLSQVRLEDTTQD